MATKIRLTQRWSQRDWRFQFCASDFRRSEVAGRVAQLLSVRHHGHERYIQAARRSVGDYCRCYFAGGCLHTFDFRDFKFEVGRDLEIFETLSRISQQSGQTRAVLVFGRFFICHRSIYWIDFVEDFERCF